MLGGLLYNMVKMKNKIKNLIVIDENYLDKLIRDYERLGSIAALIIKKEFEDLKKKSVPAEKLVITSYEAGKLDKELSLTFDNPIGRFLNTEIEL